jgi:hypothetical protein
MRRSAPLLVLVVGLLGSLDASAESFRQGGKFGLGLGGGFGVSGLSGKYFVTKSQAFQAMVGGDGVLDGDGGGGLGVGLDYLIEGPALARTEPLDIAWSIGAGGTLGVGDAVGIGASGVAGLEFCINPVPIDVVLEFRPGIVIVPEIGADIVNFSGHVRWYF